MANERETPAAAESKSDTFGPSFTLIRVILVSDVRLCRDGLVWGLSAGGRFHVVAAVEQPATALERLEASRAEVMLVDMSMASAKELIRAVRVAHSSIFIVAFTVGMDDSAVLECIEAGAHGYVSRNGTVDDLTTTVESVVRGEAQCPPRLAATLFRRVAALANANDGASAFLALTQRERQIVKLLEEGFSNREIASRLGIELATTKNHVHNILEKLHVRRRSQIRSQLNWRANGDPAWPQLATHT